MVGFIHYIQDNKKLIEPQLVKYNINPKNFFKKYSVAA